MVSAGLVPSALGVVQNFADREYFNQTTLHPVGLSVLLLLGLATLVVPRRIAVVPLIALCCFVPLAQRLVVASLDFHFVRILVVFAWLRVLTRGEYRGFRWTLLDTLVVLWALTSATAYIARVGTFGAVVNRAGLVYDTVGMYFFIRCVVRSFRDIDAVIGWLIVLSLPVLFGFAMEQLTGRNIFSVMGGVPEQTKIRGGRLRAQGAFHHPILAGCFWATLYPLVAARWWGGGTRRMQALFASVVFMGLVVLCASSTPVLVVLLSFLGAAAFFLRKDLGVIRLAIVAGIGGLSLVMEAPVYHLIARLNVVGSSTGWHRYHLIDESINRFGEWWLLGTNTTRHWGRQLFDVTNQYLSEGVQGGFFTMLLYIGLLVVGFHRVGRLWRATIRVHPYPTALTWALGVSLFAQSGMFFAIAISHAQQNMLVWFLILAMIATLSTQVEAPPRRRVARRPMAPMRPSPAPAIESVGRP